MTDPTLRPADRAHRAAGAIPDTANALGAPWRRAALALLVSLGAAAALPSPALAQGQGPDRVVYHISDAKQQAMAALRNLRNHLDTEPGTQITVVSHGNGVDFLLEDAKDPAGGTAYDALVSALKSRGVRFEVCEITLKNRNLKKEQFIGEADFTPSGVVRVTKLQREGYAYVKP